HRVPPQEPLARGPAAGDRHGAARRGDREGPRPARRADGLAKALRAGYQPREPRARHRIGFKACVSPTTSLAAVNINADGSCTVYCSTADMGQGSDTAMAQIAGEVLHMAAESVTVV